MGFVCRGVFSFSLYRFSIFSSLFLLRSIELVRISWDCYFLGGFMILLFFFLLDLWMRCWLLKR
ncbi:hypothetical protein L873DRAFT_1313609 [Choiromyces venosus 120613-1]|uniref:Uncharacterized protein n=1 Tax=Choiromyces venosus 120613-1 TaxID=1336337 RepID=A0A3N4JB29_9PEZI|nr:hypothetical protein L873DRAFT_1313609 [Choiromyces venosus 120613-1]